VQNTELMQLGNGMEILSCRLKGSMFITTRQVMAGMFQGLSLWTLNLVLWIVSGPVLMARSSDLIILFSDNLVPETTGLKAITPRVPS